jgi:hypothetical protein
MDDQTIVKPLSFIKILRFLSMFYWRGY